MIQIAAQILDATTSLGIPYATISVNGRAVGAADTNGSFVAQVNSYDDTITASSVGYVTLSQLASSVQESGIMQLAISADALQPATVVYKKPNNTWLALAGVGLIALASSNDKKKAVGKKSDYLVPVAILGIGAAYFLTRPKTPALPGNTYIRPVTTSPGGASPLLNNPAINSLANSIAKLFGGGTSSAPGATDFAPVSVQPVTNTNPASFDPAAQYPTLSDQAPTLQFNLPPQEQQADTNYATFDANVAGLGDASGATFNAGDIIGKTLLAKVQVPIYSTPRDDAKPTGYVSPGNPVGVVDSYLDPNTAEGRAELWWEFKASLDQQSLADSYGSYWVPHREGYFDIQALEDQGVLTAAQATALAAAANKSLFQIEIEKYAPWVIGGLIGIGVFKAILNKAF